VYTPALPHIRSHLRLLRRRHTRRQTFLKYATRQGAGDKYLMFDKFRVDNLFLSGFEQEGWRDGAVTLRSTDTDSDTSFKLRLFKKTNQLVIDSSFNLPPEGWIRSALAFLQSPDSKPLLDCQRVNLESLLRIPEPFL